MSALIRNLNPVNAIRQFSWPRSCVKPSRSITRVDLTLAGTVNETISSKSMRLKPSANAARAASLANPRPQYHQTLRSIGMGGCSLPVYAVSVVRRGRPSRSLKANQADQRRQSDYEWPDCGWKRNAVESNNRIPSLSKCRREPRHHDRRGGPTGVGDHEDHGEHNRSDKGVSSGRVRRRSKHVRSGEHDAYS